MTDEMVNPRNTELFGVLYDELRSLAERHLQRERLDHTLQPTALVHEAWIKLSVQESVPDGGRAHFLSIASQAMRRILVDHARRKGRVKRGDGRGRVDFDVEMAADGETEHLDLIALDEALDALAAMSTRQARIVELRFFGGLAVPEVARVLETSDSTVEREWRIARAWLLARVHGK